MPKLVVQGATLACNQGTTSSKLMIVPPGETGDADQRMLATAFDHKPNLNILPFGMCNATANPAVIAATAAANGVHTPAPCVPATSSPWTVHSTMAELQSKPLLTADSRCLCQWTGDITISDTGSEVEVAG